MTPKSELIALAEKVEQASGADRMLDAAIHSALFVDQDLVDVLDDADGEWPEVVDGGWATIVIPAYTASLDAAMTLAVDGFGSLIAGTFPGGRVGYVAVVTKPSRAEGESATPALALCAAALKARARSEAL